MQQKVWSWWSEFWDEWVPKVTRGKPYGIVINGDTTDGRHHGTTTQISQNLADQKHLAEQILYPIIERCTRREDGGPLLYMMRGTEAHVGAAGENEEMLGESLRAVPSDTGQYTRWELSLRVGGPEGSLCHFTHSIGTTGRTHYESTAPMGEMGEIYAEAGRWGDEIPDFIIRSHRHRHIKIEVATHKGYGIVEITPGWQSKTPFVYRINARNSTPQFGGIMIRQGDEEHFTRSWVKSIIRPAAEVI